MIVRILHEGQYRLPSSNLDRLNNIDNRLVKVVGADNEKEYSRLLNQMIELVRTKGEKLSSNELVESDVILPSEDTTLGEAKKLFSGEGLIPG
ncbi:MAG: hypothetical protein HYX82_00730 [Chloroflexi bacterium]|nr:hypothetical protein [Chloroflexota bacterium]